MDRPATKALLQAQTADFTSYVSLFIPPLDSIVHCYCDQAPEIMLDGCLVNLFSNEDLNKNSSVFALVLNSVLKNFEPKIVISKASTIAEMVRTVSSDAKCAFPLATLLANMGSCFSGDEAAWATFDSEFKLRLLNDIWKSFSKLEPSDYVTCADVWIDFVLQQFGPNEINIVLKDIVKHMTRHAASDKSYDRLLSVVKKVARSKSTDLAAVVCADALLPYIDLMQKEDAKVEACKVVVTEFLAKRKQVDESVEDEIDTVTITDPVLLNALSSLCKTMHDAINPYTFDDERRQIASAIIDFLALVAFDDVEAHLNFLVEARASYFNLDSVTSFLVSSVNRLAMNAKRAARGTQSKKHYAFVKACVAYAFITIPSLDDYVARLQHYLLTAEVALASNCLSQTDALLRAAIVLLNQLPATIEQADGKTYPSEPFFVSYVSNLLSFLLIVPVRTFSFSNTQSGDECVRSGPPRARAAVLGSRAL